MGCRAHKRREVAVDGAAECKECCKGTGSCSRENVVPPKYPMVAFGS